MQLLEDDLNYLISLIDKAGETVMSIYKDLLVSGPSVQMKYDDSPLTIADLSSNALLVDGLKMRWPNIPILSEEGADVFFINDVPKYYWAIDPLDGTKEFISRNAEFTINIALISRGVPVLGLVSAPALKSLYVGHINQDPLCFGYMRLKKRTLSGWQTLGLEKIPDRVLKPKIVASLSHPSIDLDIYLKRFENYDLTKAGSSLKLCYVAEGLVDLYPRFGSTCKW